MLDTIMKTITFIFLGVLLFFVFGVFTNKEYAIKPMEYWSVPCIEVYDGEELLYVGNERWSITESRGTSTLWYQKERKSFISRKVNERISPNIRSNKCKAEMYFVK